MAYIQSTINARSCLCCVFVIFFSCSQSLICSTFFSCVEKSLRSFWLTITEVSTQWTITVESLISMIHMHRGKWHWPSLRIQLWLLRWGGDRHTDTSYPYVRANWSGFKYQCWGGDVWLSQEQKNLSKNLTQLLVITLVSLVNLLFN